MVIQIEIFNDKNWIELSLTVERPKKIVIDPSKVIKTHPRMVREDFKNPPPLMDTIPIK